MKIPKCIDEELADVWIFLINYTLANNLDCKDILKEIIKKQNKLRGRFEIIMRTNDLSIKNVAIDKLKQYKNNAKEHPDWQVEKIVKSIKRFGFNDPIAVDEKGVIIEGHGRYLAAKKMKLEKVPVIILKHMSESEKKAYIIAHNKLNMDTGFDVSLLQSEIDKLLEENFDLGFAGFNEVEIMELTQDILPDKLTSDELNKYEENANAKLKSFNVIICCMNDDDKRFVSKLLREGKVLRRTYVASALKERFKK